MINIHKLAVKNLLTKKKLYLNPSKNQVTPKILPKYLIVSRIVPMIWPMHDNVQNLKIYKK